MGPGGSHFQQDSSDVTLLAQDPDFEKHCLSPLSVSTVPSHMVGGQYLLIVDRANESKRNEKMVTLIYPLGFGVNTFL